MKLLDRARGKVFEQEELILDVSEQVRGFMDAHKLKQVMLAKRLKCSEGHVSRLLDGTRNLTLRTLSDIAHELGATVTVSIKERP